MGNINSEGEKPVREMSSEDFMDRICTNASGRRITTMHVYADPGPTKEIVKATPGWVEIGRHPSMVDY